MKTLQLGLVHTPLTPFTGDMAIDFDRYGRILDFHLDNAAEALALPMHVSESVSLSDAERRKLLEFAVERVAGRVPVIAHVTQSGTDMAWALAMHAERAGAAAIVCTTPYYWKPQPAMMLQHFAEIGASVKIPFFLYNAPGEMGGTAVTTSLVLALMKRLDNFAGLIDVSMDWQFLIDVVSSAQGVKSDFQLLSGVEFLISAGAIGAKGAFAPYATVAPRLIARLYELCRAERYEEARPFQEEFARLYHVVHRRGVAGMKAAARAVRRDCGDPRPPVLPLEERRQRSLADQIFQIRSVAEEHKGW
jgi:dihydrodipicolinate synthase/N-acetylneuraminate lyase